MKSFAVYIPIATPSIKLICVVCASPLFNQSLKRKFSKYKLSLGRWEGGANLNVFAQNIRVNAAKRCRSFGALCHGCIRFLAENYVFQFWSSIFASILRNQRNFQLHENSSQVWQIEDRAGNQVLNFHLVSVADLLVLCASEQMQFDTRAC